MSGFRDILGFGQKRPPAPEVAGLDDFETYQREFLDNNPEIAEAMGSSGDSDATVQLPFSKQLNDGEQKYKAEFPWLYDPHKGVRWDFSPVELRNLSQTNTWVGMLVQSITKEVAGTPFTITKAEDEAETAKRLSTHPEKRKPIEKALPDATAENIYELLQDPNPDDNWQDMVEMWLGDLLEVGSLATVKAYPTNAYDGEEFTADPTTTQPLALQATAPEVWTKDYHDKTGILKGYWQFDRRTSPGTGATESSSAGTRGFSDPTFFDSEEMLWDDMTPRSNRRYGIPPTLLVRDFLRSLDLAVTQEQQYLSRGSIPSGAWVFEEWDRQAVKEWKEENQENVKGKPHKSLMFAGRGGDVRFEPMSMNFQELEFTERMRWYARVVSSAFQVPTAVVGIEPEKINYATFQGERENFESNTLGPYLQKLERILNDQLIHKHWGREYRFEFMPGMSESTRDMISQRVRSEFSAGIRTRNEARREVGLDPVEEEFDGFQDEVVEEVGEDGGIEDLIASIEKQEGSYDDYPDSAVENAQMALDAKEKTGNPNDCGTDVGWARANQLANREALSEETVRRMAAFRRHQDNAEMDDDQGRADCGWMMWNAWGGEEGIAWAERVVEDLDSEETEESAGDSGNSHSAVGKQEDEPLRESGEWWEFDVQPSDVEALREDIADDVREVFDRVLSDDEVRQIIDRLAGEETEKSLAALSRRLREIFDETDVVARIEDAIQAQTTAAVTGTLESALADAPADTDVDVNAIRARLEERSVEFADSFADSMSEEIQETVGDGWQEGQGTREIAENIAEQADMDEGWTGAERIARQELNVATGKAREAVASEMDKVRVWQTSQDDRVRPAHQEMQGKWAFPEDPFVVEYEDHGVEKEDVPGNSEKGIGCRCMTLLRDREEVDESDYAGSQGLN